MVVGAAVLHRVRGTSRPETAQAEGNRPIVAVARVGTEDLAQTLTISAELRPYQEVALHAKIAGYLQSIAVDVGDRVKEGQVLAKLDVPELLDDYEKAMAAHRASEQETVRAEASYQEAHQAFTRLEQVARQQPKLVAAQDLDAVRTRDAVAAGALAVARQKVSEVTAEEAKVKSMIGYTSIAAPFAGVITKRFADPGALIQAGTSSSAQVPVLHLQDDRRLRLVFPVPESAAALVTVGSPVKVKVGAVSAAFEGKVARFSGKIDRATRTMATEVEVENPQGTMKPGMYARVDLTLRESRAATAVPVQAVVQGKEPRVLVVREDGTLEERPIVIDLETPSKVGISSGLKAGEVVVVGSRSGLQPGQHVEAKVTELQTAG